MRSRVQARAEEKAHHHVTVDIFDDEITDVLDCGIFVIFIQRSGRAITQLHRRPVDLWDQTWIIIIYVVGVARVLLSI
jgi:hypothetical protein